MGKSVRLKLNVSPYEMRKIIDAKIDGNLTTKQVLEASSRPCDCCKNNIISIQNKDGKVIHIERGVLYTESECNKR